MQPTSLTIAELLRESHATAKSKGWWQEDEDSNCGRSFGDQVANFHAEIAEAWEEYRKHGLDPGMLIYHVCETRYGLGGEPYPHEHPKPEGIAVELADLFIRVADTCERYSIPLERAIREKMEFNKTRPERHGGKKA